MNGKQAKRLRRVARTMHESMLKSGQQVPANELVVDARSEVELALSKNGVVQLPSSYPKTSEIGFYRTLKKGFTQGTI